MVWIGGPRRGRPDQAARAARSSPWLSPAQNAVVVLAGERRPRPGYRARRRSNPGPSGCCGRRDHCPDDRGVSLASGLPRKPRSEPVFRGRAEGVGFEPTRTRQRPNGFQEHPWFGVRHGYYLGFQHIGLPRHLRPSRVYPVTTATCLPRRYDGDDQPGARVRSCPVTARIVQGMARVRPGRLLPDPYLLVRSVRRGSRVKRDFVCTFTRHFSPVLVGLRSQSRLRLEGRARTLSGPSPDLSPPRLFHLPLACRPPPGGRKRGQASRPVPQPMRGAHLLPWQASGEYPDARRSTVRRTGEITRIRFEEVSTL